MRTIWVEVNSAERWEKYEDAKTFSVDTHGLWVYDERSRPLAFYPHGKFSGVRDMTAVLEEAI